MTGPSRQAFERRLVLDQRVTFGIRLLNGRQGQLRRSPGRTFSALDHPESFKLQQHFDRVGVAEDECFTLHLFDRARRPIEPCTRGLSIACEIEGDGVRRTLTSWRNLHPSGRPADAIATTRLPAPRHSGETIPALPRSCLRPRVESLGGEAADALLAAPAFDRPVGLTDFCDG